MFKEPGYPKNPVDTTIIEVVREWMHAEMSDISEETICASWERGLEYRLWLAVQDLPSDHSYCGSSIPASRIERLRDVSEWLGEWAEYSHEANGVVAIPLHDWKETVEKQ